MSHWASHAIEALARGETCKVTPHGNSMKPKVESGATVTLEPVTVTDLVEGDIVLCRVKGNVLLHLVKARRGGATDRQVLIGNNRGGVNGWTKAVYGRATNIRNP